jgi:hypothetical protein
LAAIEEAGAELLDLVWAQESYSVKVLRDGNYLYPLDFSKSQRLDTPEGAQHLMEADRKRLASLIAQIGF